MAIGLKDLDAQIAMQFGEELTRLGHGPKTEGSSRRAPRMRRSAEERVLASALTRYRLQTAGGAAFVPVAGAFLCVMVGSQLGNTTLMAGLFGMSVALSGVSLWHTWNRDIMNGFNARLPSDVLLAALPTMNLSVVERLYAQTFVLLADLQTKLDEAESESIVSSLNQLLISSRELEVQAQRLREATKSHPLRDLEMEANGYRNRLAVETDESLVAAIRQSAEGCEARIADARTFESNLAKVEARRESVRQSMGSIQSALMRRQTVQELPGGAADTLADSVVRLSAETAALEEAVEEVARLGR